MNNDIIDVIETFPTTTAIPPEAPAPAKVQCGKCDNLVRRQFCAVKAGKKVSRKKVHTCDLFTPKVDREPPPPVYVPSFDKYTGRMVRRMARKMAELGISPATAGDIRVGADGQVYQRKAIEVPKTTATPGVLGTTPVQVPAPGESTLYNPAPEAPTPEVSDELPNDDWRR